jgi:predicted N-formylglutamate amidohydrolase
MAEDDTPMTDAYAIAGADRPARWLVTCDHATNRVPGWVGGGSLGIAPEDMNRHIALDVGAAGLALRMAERLDAPCILSDFSRLVIDPNRGEDDPTLVMRLYDGTIIPANRRITPPEVRERLDRLYRPYHSALARLAARRADTVIVAVHSFTACLRGRPPRPWHAGILYPDQDPRLSRPLIAELASDPALCVGDNQPYHGWLPGDSIDRHALRHGRHNTLIEVRNDLISDVAGQADWADRLASALIRALQKADHDHG